MKFLILALFLGAVLARGLPQNSDALDFATGLLSGIRESGDPNKLSKCVKDIQITFNQLKAALVLLGKMSNIQAFVMGLEMFVNATREFFTSIKPCAKDFAVVAELARAVAKAEPRKIAVKVIGNPAPFLRDILNASDFFRVADYKNAGKAVGDLLRLLFLARVESSAQDQITAQEFVKGFLVGIGERRKAAGLDACLKDLTDIFNATKVALDYLRYFSLSNVDTGFGYLFYSVQELMAMVKPCAAGYRRIARLTAVVMEPNVTDIVYRVPLHNAEYLHDVRSALGCFVQGRGHCSGKAVGDMINMMFF